jgi:hypothetical protein
VGLITLNPNGVVPGYPQGPYTLVGAGTIDAALADASDSTYIQTDDSAPLYVGLLFPIPSFPAAGALVTGLQMRLRRSVNSAAAPTQHDPFWWNRLEANDNGVFGTGQGIGHHDRFMGDEMSPNLDGTTAIQTTTSSIMSWFSDGTHVRNMRWGDPRFILTVFPTFAASAQIRLYKAELLIWYNTMPTVSVTAPADPINTSKPTVVWTHSDPDNEPQYRARVVVVKPGTPSDYWPYGLPGQAGYQADGARTKAYDSGELFTGGNTHDVTVGLTNGQQYYFYVRTWGPNTADTEQRSSWYYKIATITATGPTAPIFTVTTDSPNGRILLNVQEGSTSSPHAAFYEIERLDPGETDYTPVRNATQVGTYVGSKATGLSVGWATPDRSEFLFTNGFSVKWYGRLTDYTPTTACTLISKGFSSSTLREWIFRNRTDGKLELAWSTAGTSYDVTATSSVAHGVTDNTDIWFQAVVIASTNPWNVLFYKSTDGVNFTQIGSTVTGTGPKLLSTLSTAGIYLGGLDAFASEAAVGLTYEAIVYDQTFSRIVAHPVIKGQPQLTTSFIDETGNTWTYTAGSNGYNVVELVVYDYEAPLGVPVTYEARAWRSDTDVVPTTWATAAGGPWTLTGGTWKLKDPMVPTNSMTITVVRFVEKRQKPQTAGIPIGDSPGVVTHSGVRGSILEVEIRLLGQTAFDQFMALIESGRTLLLQGVLGRQWYVQAGPEIPAEILKAAPNVGEGFPIRHAHVVAMRFTEVMAP